MANENNAAVAAIQFALKDDDGLAFLQCWNEGDFQSIRKEWPDAPESVFAGADPLYPEDDRDHVEAMVAATAKELETEAPKILRITHHYDIGNQDVYVKHPTGELDGRRVALYLWFKAEQWFGDRVLISNLGIAAAMVAFYGFRHSATDSLCATVDLYSDAEGVKDYEALMSDASLHREGLREAMAPHVA